jgi:hypothetical protein
MGHVYHNGKRERSPARAAMEYKSYAMFRAMGLTEQNLAGYYSNAYIDDIEKQYNAALAQNRVEYLFKMGRLMCRNGTPCREDAPAEFVAGYAYEYELGEKQSALTREPIVI